METLTIWRICEIIKELLQEILFRDRVIFVK